MKTLLSLVLDVEGAETIKLRTSGEPPEEEAVARADRRRFRLEENGIVTTNEVEVILDVLHCSISASPKGWRFSDGDVEFSADVEDREFLDALKSRKITLADGTSLRARLRTIQYRASRTQSMKIVTQVLEVIPPEA